MDGKWLIEPDGSWGFAATFLMEQWEDNLSTDDFIYAEKTSFSMYPNPTSEYFKINDINSNVQVNIFDLQGRLVKSIMYSSDMKINIKDLNSGTYFVSIKNTNEQITAKKLIIK